MFGIPLGRILAASIITGFIGIGILVNPDKSPDAATIYLESQDSTYSVGDTFTVTVVAETHEPVNVFKGLVTFNPSILQITAIDYNTSLLDLWAERPWYSNGDGTLNFIGATTVSGGFTGKDTLLTITYTAKAAGTAIMSMKEIRILKHDGLGSDALVNKPIDSLFSITEELLPGEVVKKPKTEGPALLVLPAGISTDLNNDGEQTIADVSIFTGHLATGNLQSDFNQDGTVNLKDLSIIMR